MNLKTVVFLLIVSAVLLVMGSIFSFFQFLATITACGAGVVFLVWLFNKFYGNKK